MFADENRKKRRQRIKLDPGSKTAQVLKQKEGSDQVEQTYDIHPETLDIAAVAFQLRNKDLKVGAEYEVPVFTGVKSFTLKATVECTQSLSTKFGDKDVFKVRVSTQFDGKLAAKRDIFAYFTTDPAHIPVKIEAEFAIGSVVAEMTEYKPGRALALGGSPPNGG